MSRMRLAATGVPVERAIASRRLLLTGAAAGGLFALSGCSVDPPSLTASPPTAPAPPPPTPTPPPSVDRDALVADLEALRTARGGTMGLAIHDLRNDARFVWRPFSHETLSTIKVLILMACLQRLEDLGETFTQAQEEQARRMIQSSDNQATNALLTWVGAPRVTQVAKVIGLSSTTFRGGTAEGTEDWWGYSTSSVDDMVRLVDAVSVGTVINEKHSAYVRDLMIGIVRKQRWGVNTPPLPSDVLVENKNGWGPRKGEYVLNSIGRVSGQGRDYTMAIFLRSPSGFSQGKVTISRLAVTVHEAMIDRL